MLFILFLVLIVASVSDIKTRKIPNSCSAVILVLGVIQIISDRDNIVNYLLGFFAVSTVLFVIWLISKGKAIGGGDVKLLAASGLLLGLLKIILAFAIGCVLGAVIHLLRMKFQGADRRFAFGPYLSMGIAVAALYGEEIIKYLYYHSI